MTTRGEGLRPELFFEVDGHVSDLCLTCVADGELSEVPPAALAHLDGCEPCGRRLGEAALLSIAAGDALELSRAASVAVVPVRAVASVAPVSPRRMRRPMPIAAMAAAVAIAFMTAGPALMETIRGVPALLAGVLAWLPAMTRIGGTVLSGAPSALGPWVLGLKVMSAVVLVVLGMQVARAAGRVRSLEEGGV